MSVSGQRAGSARPASARHLDRRAAIVSAAAGVFHEKGYGSASMNDVALAAGVAKPTLYHYFRSKDEILVMVLDEWIELLAGRHAQRVDEGTPPRAQIEGVIADIFSFMDSHRGHVAAFFESYRELPDDARVGVRRRRLEYRRRIELAFTEGIASGDFRAVDVQLATLALFGMCNWSYRWYSPDDGLSPERVAAQFWDLLERGITALPPS